MDGNQKKLGVRMTEELKDLDSNTVVTRNHLRDVLKFEAKNLHVKDIMLASSFLREDAKYMPESYREDYIQRFSKTFFNRIKDIKDDKKDYQGKVDDDKLFEFLKLLRAKLELTKSTNEKCFLKIACIISTYTTYVLEESIHPIGTKFPGGFILHLEEGKYICPVKDSQKTNPSALCKFCVAIQDSNV